ncbi:MAG: zinc-binding alcohol dehydrogenase family protein [Cyclobacteriaceae bacterium]
MKYIVCEEPGRFELKTKEIPVRKSGESLLKIKRIGVCGTDIHAFGGTQPYFEYPRILGHEVAAEYVEGEAEGFNQGDRLTFIPYFHCGECVACRSGLTNCCVSIKVFGVHTDGGMAEYVSIPDQFLLKADDLVYDQLALVEPLAIAAHGVRRALVLESDTVLIMGAGPIGLGLMEFALLTGAKVIAMDINDFRLKFCKNEVGVHTTVNPKNADVAVKLAELTHGDMPTVVIDATGNRNVMNQAFGYMAHGGRYVLVGLQKGELQFNHPDFHKRESTLMSSRNASSEDFNHVMECLKSGKIDANKFITHRSDFEGMIDNFSRWADPENQTIKALISLD